MRKSLLAALIAATTMVPVAAIAQDREGRGNRGGWSERAGENRGDRPRQNWQRPEGQARPERPQRPEGQRPNWQPRPQAQPSQDHVQPRGNGGGMLSLNRERVERMQRENNNQPRQPQVQRPQEPVQRPQEQVQRRENGGGMLSLNRERIERMQRDQQARDQRNRWDNDRRNDRGHWNNNHQRDRNWNGNRGGWNNNHGNYNNWHNNWRSDRRYNWNAYRNANRHAFRLPRYYAPPGYSYGYRRFGIGFTLSSSLFAQNYWINQPSYYRLPEAYGPYRWVRYYNDALLIDTYSGAVVDAIYDIFW